MRRAEVERVTRETSIQMTLNLDGGGRHDVRTDCGFLDHMLELLAYHGRFDLTWLGSARLLARFLRYLLAPSPPRLPLAARARSCFAS